MSNLSFSCAESHAPQTISRDDAKPQALFSARYKKIDENCALSRKWGLLFPAEIQNNCCSNLTQFQTNNVIMESFSIARQEEKNQGSHGDYLCFFAH